MLIVLERGDDDTYKSVRNLKHVHVLYSDQLNAYDAVVSDDIVFTKAAFDCVRRFQEQTTEEAGK